MRMDAASLKTKHFAIQYTEILGFFVVILSPRLKTHCVLKLYRLPTHHTQFPFHPNYLTLTKLASQPASHHTLHHRPIYSPPYITPIEHPSLQLSGLGQTEGVQMAERAMHTILCNLSSTSKRSKNVLGSSPMRGIGMKTS